MDKLLYKIKRMMPKKLFEFLQPAYHFLIAGLASLIYRFPSEHLVIIGVTGTTGKTTVVYLIAKILNELGIKTGYTSTAMLNDGKKEWLNDKKMTMAGRFFTQRMLKQMAKNDCRAAVIETTSEGIRQFRHRFINFDIALFTGLYPEHIESHGSFEKYKQAKGLLFKHLKKGKPKFVDENNRVQIHASGVKKTELKRIKKTIIANKDDDHYRYFLDFWAEKKYAYGLQEEWLENPEELVGFSGLESSRQGLRFKALGQDFKTRLLGAFNAYNAMAALACGHSMGLPGSSMKQALARISGVPGRFEQIDCRQNFSVIVDYAFEPNAVSKLYETVKILPHNRIIHVLGSAGGGRDIAKRPVMGRIAGENAAYVIVTDEDPYDDDPLIIIDQVALGAQKAGKKEGQNLFKIKDRRKAVKKAFSLAGENDIVLITGKGSEQAICRAKGEKENWDDRAVARGLLSELRQK